jgi:hypothetical protein
LTKGGRAKLAGRSRMRLARSRLALETTESNVLAGRETFLAAGENLIDRNVVGPGTL